MKKSNILLGKKNYQAVSKSNIAEHKMAVHERVKYTCEQCGHQLISKGYLAK